MEYFMYLLDKITKGEKQSKGSDPGKIFEFELETRKCCTVCNRVQYNV